MSIMHKIWLNPMANSAYKGVTLCLRYFYQPHMATCVTPAIRLPGVRLRHELQYHLCSIYRSRVVRVGGRPAVVAQWQSTGCTSQVSLA